MDGCCRLEGRESLLAAEAGCIRFSRRMRAKRSAEEKVSRDERGGIVVAWSVVGSVDRH